MITKASIVKIGEHEITILVDDALKGNEFYSLSPLQLTDDQKREICKAYGVPEKYLTPSSSGHGYKR